MMSAITTDMSRKRRQLTNILRELRGLGRIGMALMLERNHEALLHQIVEQGGGRPVRATVHSTSGASCVVAGRRCGGLDRECAAPRAGREHPRVLRQGGRHCDRPARPYDGRPFHAGGHPDHGPDGRGRALWQRPLRDVRFTREQLRELHFTALLHDFGKITVREDVLRKAKKLPPLLLERFEARFDLIRRTLEVEYYRKREDLLRSNADPDAAAAVEANFAERVDRLEHMRSVVRLANEPMLTAGASKTDLLVIARHSFERADGSLAPYLTDDELHFLHIPCGTLDAQERAEIESHVEETYRFLTHIPWTNNLKNLPAFAHAHHEKLDGTGYPKRIRGDQIPIRTRMLTIADIFDALTASDRPYKRAVSADDALDIIRSEARAGRLDVQLVSILIESQVYRRILEEDWRRF